ncbi:MAG: phage tail assembly chaperone [Rhodospirillaceae bacterium]|nr:phage tail assembly chaperone [Rhodospirillaceae bacterium]
MELGLGWLRFSPDVFWSMTLRELMTAVDGYMESHGMGHPGRKAQMYDELMDLAESVPDVRGSIG